LRRVYRRRGCYRMENAEKRLCISPLRLSKCSKEVREFLGVELGLKSNRELEGGHLKKRVLCS
jgi:hypothetical protein